MKFWLSFFFLFVLTGCAVNHKVMLGDESVIIQQIKGKDTGKTFIHVHHNEQTALNAAKKVVHQDGGHLITLIHSGGRNIVFHLDKRRYEFDPNRIYTDTGIKQTLSQFGPYTPKAHQEVKKLAIKITQLLPQGKVIAVHNNASYSLKDYLPGHSLAHDAEDVHFNSEHYYRNFFLVTRLSDFRRFKMDGFNGVLQKNSATDDGSLSIYLARREYINVEAGFDQLAEQIKMLKTA